MDNPETLFNKKFSVKKKNSFQNQKTTKFASFTQENTENIEMYRLGASQVISRQYPNQISSGLP